MSKRINRDDVDKLYDYDLHIPSRTLYMGSVSTDPDNGESGVDAIMAERLIKGLHILDRAAPAGDQPITIMMNNPGGDEYDGFAIFDAIRACKNHVTIIVYGKAMSMGGIILQAADKRIMSPTSRFMMHYGTFGIQANAQDVYKWVDDNKKLDTLMEDIFIEKMLEKDPKFSRKKLQEMLKADFIVDAKEAVELGLADEVLGEEEEEGT
jgi:ATP-dependent Clp endopeptidase proteolytic subunit ClpP